MFGGVSFSQYVNGFMIDVIILAGIPLLVATIVGLIVSFFQAVTQIQDQTLGLTIKISAITFVLLSFGGVLSQPLISLTQDIFSNFDQIVF